MRVATSVDDCILGSRGCQPVLFGSLPKSSSNLRSDEFLHGVRRSPASCRRLRADSLCSPEKQIVISSPSHFLRRLSYVGGVRRIVIFGLCIFEIGPEIERLRGTGTCVGEAGESYVVQVDRA